LSFQPIHDKRIIVINSERKVVIRKIFPVGLKRVWDAFTKKDDMLKWHSPVGMTNPHAEVDLRVGGNYAIQMEYNESGEVVTVRGEYKEIKEFQKLVYTWKWDGSEMNTLVTVEFRKVTDDKTEIILTHRGFDERPTEVDLKNNWTKESHKSGWTTAFQKLAQILQK